VDKSLFSLGACAPTLTRLATLATLSRSAGEGLLRRRTGMLTPMGLRRQGGQIAVGTSVTRRPPHRSGRASFSHPAPTSGA